MSNLNNDIITVPVLLNFDKYKEIGSMTINAGELPPSPNFVFALGYAVLEWAGQPGEAPVEPAAGKYKLCAVAVVSDDSYLKYLQQIEVAKRGGTTTSEKQGSGADGGNT